MSGFCRLTTPFPMEIDYEIAYMCRVDRPVGWVDADPEVYCDTQSTANRQKLFDENSLIC